MLKSKKRRTINLYQVILYQGPHVFAAISPDVAESLSAAELKANLFNSAAEDAGIPLRARVSHVATCPHYPGPAPGENGDEIVELARRLVFERLKELAGQVAAEGEQTRMIIAG